MFGNRIKIDTDLYARLETAASKQGYSSTDEFINHVLEESVETDENNESEQAVKDRLKGLGYIE